MKVTSTDKSIRDIFKAHYFKIPRFQRPYSWTLDNIEEFWNDVISENSGEYFIGSMVVYKISESLKGLVDGQQRLTTITIFLSALRNAFDSIEEKKLANGTHRFIEREDEDDENQYILQTETSYPYFQECIQTKNTSDIEIPLHQEEKNLESCFKFFTQKIKHELTALNEISQNKLQSRRIKKLKEIRDKILDLKIILIDLDNEEDAYIIFETLNTRGKNLKVSDLVKNLITKSFKKKNKGVDIAKDQWGRCVETIETSTKDLNMDTFLLHFWLSKYDYTSQSKLFKKIKNHVDSHNVKDFLKEVELNSRIYREIREINFREWTNQEEDLKRSIKALIDFKVTQPIPMILSGFRDKFQKDITLKQLKELIKTIEHFHFLFTAITSKRSSGGISLMYSSLAKRFSNCSGKDSKNLIIKELKLKLKERRPSLEEFIAGFKELEFTSKRTKDKNIIRYVLRKLYEYDNKPTVTGTPIDFEKMTIEHLTPDSSGYDWKGKVGNLIFVGQELNDKLGTKKFIDKKKVLKKSNLFIDHEINRAKKWNRDTVNDRTEYMATKCYQVIFKM